MNLFCPKCEEPYETEDEAATCPDCGSEGLKPGPAKSILVVEFAAPASTQFNMQAHGIVTREQLVVVGNFLLTRARAIQIFEDTQAIIAQLEAQAEKEEESKIMVPGMSPDVMAHIARTAKGN